MKKSVINIAFAVAFVILGLVDIITQRGSHILSESTVYRYKLIPFVDVRYTGVPAIVEGLIFIGAGILFLCRAWAGRDDKERSD